MLWNQNDSTPDCSTTVSKTIASCTSLVGCTFTFLFIVFHKKYKSLTHRLILTLLLISFIVPCCCLNPKLDGRAACQVTAFIFNFAIVSQRLIMICITIYLLLLVVKEQQFRYLESTFHVFIWGIALLDSFLPLFKNAYGNATDWCWILKEYSDFRIICFYGPMLIFVAVEIVVYAVIIRKVRKEFVGVDAINPERYEWYKKYIRPLYYFPLVNILLAIPTTAFRIQQYVNISGDASCTLTIMHSIIFPIWGLVYSLMFLFDEDTRRLSLSTILCREIYNASISVISNSRVSNINPFSSENRPTPSLGDYAFEEPLIDDGSHFRYHTFDMTTDLTE